LPNLTSHVALALAISEELKVATIQEHLGSYLLGSTSPDIRIITHQSREVTHYSHLDSSIIGDGVAKLLAENPYILDASRSSGTTRAFICGYITHLISDQIWIMTMYRPYFGNREVFPDSVLANIWDRALQLELDRQDRPVWEEVACELETAVQGLEIPFISLTNLEKWSEWIGEYAKGAFSWQRLTSLARRQAVPDETVVTQTVENFLSDIPTGLDQIFSRLGQDDLVTYRTRAIQGSVQSIQTFLGS